MNNFIEKEKFIMATIGPTFESEEQFRIAISKNCTWFRLPLGYRNREHVKHVALLRKIEKETNVKINILADLPSERPRIKSIQDFELFPGLEFSIGDNTSIPVTNFMGIIPYLSIGENVKFLDGRITCKILSIEDCSITLKVITGKGIIKSNNSIVFSDSPIRYKAIVPDDLVILKEFEKQGTPIDWIALSMISSKKDIEEARSTLLSNLNKVPCIMSKIEIKTAVDNLEDIVKISDGIMVARGDLGQSIPYEDLPNAEKLIVDYSRSDNKIVFIATQTLEVFAESGLPQRSELIDLANVKWLHADGVMLGKETVWSKHPIECIDLASKVMQKTSDLDMDWVLYCKKNECNLVAIEGPDGVGKTSVIEELKAKGFQTIRGIPKYWENAILKKLMISTDSWISSAMYFLSGGIENKKFINIDSNFFTFSDRCIWSSLAVHYKKDPKLLPEICKLLSLFSKYAQFPRKIFVLNPGFKNIINRINMKTDEEREFDALLPLTTQAYDNEMNFFKWLQDIGIPVVFIDSLGTPEVIADQILSALKE